MKRKILLFLLFGIITIVTSCGVNSNIMLKQAKGTEVNSAEIPLTPKEDYRIAANDKISFQMFSNEGADLLNQTNSPNQSVAKDNQMIYDVRTNGNVELPIIGSVKVSGLTIEACEDTLETLYSSEFKDPFIKITVTNQRVIVFPGNGSDAKVVQLTNPNTTLLEAIALAGGIADRGKANTVKLMRIENGERIVYVMDLSVIEGLKFTDMIVQANDYIYVEPAPELGKEVIEKIIPVTSLITTFILLVTFIANL
jgi:polysaccharide biosynthesis/export protein